MKQLIVPTVLALKVTSVKLNLRFKKTLQIAWF